MPTTDLSLLPADFPRTAGPSALSGAQSKMALVAIDGRFVAPGLDPDALVQLHAWCESLAQKIAAHAKGMVDQGRAQPHRALKAQLNELRKEPRRPDTYNLWTIRRVERLNGWPAFDYDPPGTYWVELTPEQLYALNPVTVRRPVYTRVEELKYRLRSAAKPNV